ncbi:cytochrome-c peroxidase [Crocinitomicaceae bacterium CZZ-1]|uniref:Cytochrome-c peroxidase n=1 Tax=Taishania pollutisoli TaxID=2766479 RepID=A0A8J6PD96_9FLAO|nr:cytochrome c peroxidase [Taishania pollutisoli]MBC9813017.1 cytochrome-c peroxidase [Taishania pollutisoli]
MKYFNYLVAGFLLLTACKKDPIEVIDATPEEVIAFRYPPGFPATVYPLGEKPVNAANFKLGRALFYSTILSSDNTVSCATCHAQTHSFADHNIALSIGVGGAVGARNAPPIFNMAWQPHFMWDGGVNHLELFSIAPITNPVEMNETMAGVIQKLNASDYWRNWFKSVYGTNEVTDQQLFVSLTQYMLMIISDGTQYDKVMKGEASFTAEQQAGYELFLQKCASCHTEPLFTDFSFRNNGLDVISVDDGRFLITQNESDRGRFKVPTLRNVLLTYPYMHDGRFFTIDQVLEHYNSGVKAHANLDPLLQNGIPLSADDKKHLKRFLETLNDYKLMGDKLLSEP